MTKLEKEEMRKKMNEKKIRRKLVFVVMVFTFCLIGLGGRIYYIKTVHGEEYEQRAKSQLVSSGTMITPNRGSIVDRNKQPLASSVTVYNVILDPLTLSDQKDVKDTDREKTLTTLSTLLELNYDELKNMITINPETQEINTPVQYKIIKKGISVEQAKQLEDENLKCVYLEKDTKRTYPTQTVGAQVIGFIRGDKWGLERQYDSDMSGIPGRSFSSFDDSNTAVAQEIEAVDGNTIVTTIDYTLQQYAEQSVQIAMDEYNPANAGVIIMNPNTGEILAMAAAPSFNTETPAEPLKLSDPAFAAEWETKTEEEKYEYLNSTWKNFNISTTYEPGSIFKPIVAAAALEEGLITPEKTYVCPGHKQVADRDISCHLRSGHGTLNLEGVLAQSCNVGMMDIGAIMGKHIFYKYQKDFGIGSLTGIDLPSEESSASLMFSEEIISEVDLATMSFGQSFNVTSLQAINALACVINGGNLMRPYVVSQVLDKSGTVIKENKPEVVRKVISKETSDIIRQELKATVEYGTGKKIKMDGYSIGAKTGTAQQGDRSKDIYTVTYAVFLPVEKPEVIMLCVIHHPEYYVDGVTSAASMTKHLVENVIKYMNIEPSYETEDTPLLSSDKEMVEIKDYQGQNVPDVVNELDNLGITYEVVGSGNLVTNQAPHGGTQVEKGSQILLYVTRAEGEEAGMAVPDVKGLSYEDAAGRLTAAGFSAVTNGETEGVVVSQDPKGGVSAPSGSDVTLTFGVQEENTPE